MPCMRSPGLKISRSSVRRGASRRRETGGESHGPAPRVVAVHQSQSTDYPLPLVIPAFAPRRMQRSGNLQSTFRLAQAAQAIGS